MAKEKDEEKKAAKLRELMTETIPQTMVVVLLYIVFKYIFSSSQAKLEARLVERGGQFFAGNHLTWADLHVFKFLDELRIANDIKVNIVVENITVRIMYFICCCQNLTLKYKINSMSSSINF